jgi:enoyl-CoA hydratase/carnithine racemase
VTPSSRAVLVAQENGIGQITLNRPRAFNSLTSQIAEELDTALTALAGDDSCAAIFIRGAGGNFSSGGDLKLFSGWRANPGEMHSFLETFGRTLRMMATLPVPVVATIEGVCLAGGFELAQACDFAVASDDALIGDGHIEFAQLPGGGGAVKLPRSIGRQAALGVLLTGDRFTGSEAAERGLVYQAFPAGEFAAGVEQLAAVLRRRGRGPLEAMKRTVVELEALPLDEALAREREACAANIGGPVGQAGLDRFLARRGGA